MHDPMTVICHIRIPYWFPRPLVPGNNLWKECPSIHLATLWHVDPETDGSDDSCGWSSPKLTKNQIGHLNSLAEDPVTKTELLFHTRAKTPSPCDGYSSAKILAVLVHQHLGSPLGKTLPGHVLDELVSGWWQSMSFLPGWHSNGLDDSPSYSGFVSHRKQVIFTMARFILRETRPWYQHPRWHVHHWRLQVPLFQDIRRFFQKCPVCGARLGRFGKGGCPTVAGWESEQVVSCQNCSPAKKGSCAV